MTGHTGENGTTGGEPTPAERIRRLLRNETVFTSAELRVDVARTISRLIAGDESVTLDDGDETHARRDWRSVRGERGRTVAGRYEREVEEDDLHVVEQSLEERVHGGVHAHARGESDLIVGGAYVNTIAGPWILITGWADRFMWGGWLEADAARIEFAGLMIRSHMFYAHAAGARVTKASVLTDDFTTRIESWGVLTNMQTMVMDAATPGGGVTVET